MRYRLACFDLDGTLLDTLGGLTFSLNAARRMNNLEPQTEEQVRTYIGNGVVKFKIKLTKKGKYTAKIKFAGDKTYEGSSKSIKITIK